MISKNTTEPNKATQPDIENTSIGILLNSLATNGVIVDAERFTQLYLTEINIAYNDGQLTALSSLAK
jgi:hypothetical protein